MVSDRISGSSSQPPVRYGFIGLGTMGWGMANNLRARIPETASLTVCEIVTERRDKFLAQCKGSVIVANTPREVVEQSNIVLTMLPKGPHVWGVFTDPETGILAADSSALKNNLFIECSTIDVKTSLRIADEVKKLGAGEFADAPVSGGIHGSTAGTLSFMIGSDTDELFGRVKSVVALMGKQESIFHCGKTGAGLITKQINNYLSSITMIGTCEAMNMGLRSCLDPAKLASVISVSTGGCYNCTTQNPVRGVSPIASSANDFNGGFPIEMCKGVLDMALDYGETMGAKFVLADTVQSFYQFAANNEMCKGKDFRSIWMMFAEADGREVEVWKHGAEAARQI